MTCGVYRIDIGPYFYYGSSNNLNGRKSSHLCALRKGRHRNRWMQRAFDRYGEFEFGVIEECEIDTQYKAEQAYLDLAVSDAMCMNMVRVANEMTFDVRMKIADTHTGMLHTEESKAKMRKPKSPEHAEKCRENGRKSVGSVTPEGAERQRISATGRLHTPETKEKNRIASTGRTHSPEVRQRIKDGIRWRKERLSLETAIAT